MDIEEEEFYLGRVYKIFTTNETINPEKKIYIGSTHLPVRVREAYHISKYWSILNKIKKGLPLKRRKGSSSKFMYEEFGLDNCVIEIIEDNIKFFDMKSKPELRKREQYWIDHYTNTGYKCVNSMRAYTSPEVKKQQNIDKLLRYRQGDTYKNRMERDKDKIKEYHLNYNEVNKEIIKEKRKKYREENPQKIKEQKRIDYQKRKEYISAKSKTKIVCECGTKVCRGDIAKHKRTQKHIKLMNGEQIYKHKRYTCICGCDISNKPSDIIRHEKTKIHLNLIGIQVYNNPRYTCGCGCNLMNNTSVINRHEKTKKHQQWLESQLE